MASVTGRDIILRLMEDVAALKHGQERLISMIIDHASGTRATLERMAVHLEQMLEHQGELEGRMDSHEERLTALERAKSP